METKWIKAVGYCTCGGAITIDGPDWKSIDPALDAFNRSHPKGEQHDFCDAKTAAQARRAKAKKVSR